MHGELSQVFVGRYHNDAIRKIGKERNEERAVKSRQTFLLEYRLQSMSHVLIMTQLHPLFDCIQRYIEDTLGKRKIR